MYATLIEVFTQQGKWDLLQTALQVKEWLEAQGVDPEVCVWGGCDVGVSVGERERERERERVGERERVV